MRNITQEAKRYRQSDEPQMPSIAEFGAAKLREGFGILGDKFNNKKNKMKTKAEILAVEAELRKLGAKIGRDVIKQIGAGDTSPIVDSHMIEEAQELLEQQDFLREQLED